ncbi:hypothetical protein HOLleu_41994 [Holothuria leucospilota]|uniref:Tyrosine-protein kinase ephrin type A/B receptor-like domain-containing protein n=1 Tax=Holothuria leucospilota TaxID=206669 RepID=A0A9Q0YH62_HOLLE|nr:hypothetical protein HOLleu_41994 [Holothuria leucospilota]
MFSLNSILNCESVLLPKRIYNLNIKCVSTRSTVFITVLSNGQSRYALDSGGFECGKKRGILNGGNINCTSCPSGTFGNKVDLGCLPCPGGFYQDKVGTVSDEAGGISCQTCNPGTYVPLGSGNSSKSCQVCPEGTNKTRYAGFRACFCLDNYYRKDRFGKCLLFYCDSFFLDELKNSSISLLHSDYSINCNSTTHKFHMLLSAPLLVFIICFPVVLFIVLKRYYKLQLSNGYMTRYSPWVSFLCESYKPECWYWEIFELFRKAVLIAIPVMFGWSGSTKIIALSFSTFFIIVYIEKKPMKDKGEATLQLTSLFLVHFNIIAAAVVVTENVSGAIFVLISILNTGFALLVAGKPIRITLRQIRILGTSAKCYETEDIVATFTKSVKSKTTPSSSLKQEYSLKICLLPGNTIIKCLVNRITCCHLHRAGVTSTEFSTDSVTFSSLSTEVVEISE